MKKTSIHPADAADDMQRSYDREVRRHRRQRRRTINMVVSWGVVVLLVAAAGLALLKRNDARSLPKAAFEVAAERTVAAGKSASAKPKAAATTAAAAKRTSSKSSTGGTKTASAQSARAKTAAAKVAAPATSQVAKTSMNAPITAASIAAPIAIHLGVSPSGYSPSRLTAPAGVPLAITLDGITGGDYYGFEMPTLNISANNNGQAVTIELPAQKPGTYPFSSSVGTIKGTLVVK